MDEELHLALVRLNRLRVLADAQGFPPFSIEKAIMEYQPTPAELEREEEHMRMYVERRRNKKP